MENTEISSLKTNPLFKKTAAGRKLFRAFIYDYYKIHKREFAWRQTDNPYYIVVSEIMLQQTQTERVKSKFNHFITQFPSVEALANASLDEVIVAWQGLGYNRRAIALHNLAQRVKHQFNGNIPSDPSLLETFKGIGPATAASICAFAFSRPTVFIETNIRAVFIHCFFSDTEVHDKDILPLVELTVDQKDPRNWYYALMDMGVMLKKSFKNPSRKSAHYTVQSKFEGSDRQVRGRILKLLIETSYLSADIFYESLQREQVKIQRILEDLEMEGFIVQQNGIYSLNKT